MGSWQLAEWKRMLATRLRPGPSPASGRGELCGTSAPARFPRAGEGSFFGRLLVGRLLAFLAAIVWSAVVLAGNDAKPVELIEELPTLKCLGVRWIIAGDKNRNAEVTVAYREIASSAISSPWKRGPNLFRVQSEAVLEPNQPAAGQTMFAGSIFDLDEGPSTR